MNLSAVQLDAPGAAPQANVRTDSTKLREVVEQLVGVTFFETMLKMAHNSPFKGEYGHGGRGEEVFTSQMDSLLAERLGKSGRFGLVEATYRRLAGSVEQAPEIHPIKDRPTDPGQETE